MQSETEKHVQTKSGLPDLSTRTVLLAEDNALNQVLAVRLLERAGCKVAVANNGLEAIALLKDQQFDCILMDMQMPELDGLEATRRIRAVQDMAEVPIIAMTANVMEEDKDRCLEAGMDDFLTKPIQPHELYRVVEHWVNQS